LNTSPYAHGYGTKWPSSLIVSDVYRFRHQFSDTHRGIDFGCGLGAHGRLLESLNFSEVFYIDNDPLALQQAQNFLESYPFSGTRFFHESLAQIPRGVNFEIAIDRASLQHVSNSELGETLSHLALLLTPFDESTQQSGLLVSEWIVADGTDMQTKRFPNITYFDEAKPLLSSLFQFRSVTYQTLEQTSQGDVATRKIVNVVLSPIIFST